MTAPDNHVIITFPSKTENIGFARTAAAVFASQLGFTLDELEEIKVAASEAVSNAIAHGYPDGEGVVEMRLAVEGDALIIDVEDKGRGIDDVEWAQQPANTTRPEEHMGLGMVFMCEYMDDVTVRSAPGQGTAVRMRKAASQPARAKSVLP